MTKTPTERNYTCDCCKEIKLIRELGGLGICINCWNIVKSFPRETLRKYVNYEKYKKRKKIKGDFEIENTDD